MDSAANLSNQIRTTAEQLAGADIASLHGDSLGHLLVDLELLRNAVEATAAVALARFEADGTWAADGSSSSATWLAARTGTAAAELRRRRPTGDGLGRLPRAQALARAGRLSPDHLRGLATCASRDPERAARDEAFLIDVATRLAPREAYAELREWAVIGEPALACPADGTHGTSPVGHGAGWLQMSRTLTGRWRLHGELDDHGGELLHGAVEAEVDARLRAGRDGDPSVTGRPIAALRAEALIDVVAQSMRREPSDRSVPDRYRVAVVVRADRGVDPRRAIALCDAPAYRAVLGAASEVLDVGRLTDRWPAGLRRAITLRDGGCVFAGCDRPPSWCDVHHCLPWSLGGATTLDNGALLCRRHHVFVHANGWRVAITHPGGRPEIRRPDGTVHTVPRWPAGRGP